MPVWSECDARFRPLLANFDRRVLNSTYNTVYGLWPDLTLAYMNPAWFVFAYENGGEPAVSKTWTLGRNVLEAIPDAVRAFYEVNYRQALLENRPWEHDYECPSDEFYRRFHLTVYPLGNAEGLLLVNSRIVESKLRPQSNSLLKRFYVDQRGRVRQCCHCRRFRRLDLPHTWDWIQAWVQKLPRNVDTGICEACLSFYYQDSQLVEASRTDGLLTVDAPPKACGATDGLCDSPVSGELNPATPSP
jgi:hypothetical protein